MTDASRSESRQFIERFGVSLGTLAIIVAQTVAVTAWLASNHAEIIHLLEHNSRQDQRLDNVEANGSRVSILKFQGVDAALIANNRQIELLQKRIEDERSAVQNQDMGLSKLQAQIDLLKQENNRIEEQQTRILQALDNTYNLLQEHLRTHAGNSDKGPPNLDLRRK